MKKYGISLLALVCCLGFFVACSDDDDNGGGGGNDPVWSDYVATFSTDNVLSVNGVPNEDKEVQVVLAKGSGDNAKLTLKNILIESAALEIDNVEMKEATNGTYTFSADQTVAETLVTVSGILTPGTVTKATGSTPVELSLTVSRKVTSDLVGKWNLDMENAFSVSAKLTEEIDPFSNAVWIQVIEAVDNLVNNALTAKVDDVIIDFQEKGMFDFSWLPKGENSYKTLANLDNEIAAGILSAVTFEYYVNDDVAYIGVDKGLLDLISMLGQYPATAGYLEYAQLLLNFFVIQGSYAMLPVNVGDGEDSGKAFSLTIPGEVITADLVKSLLPQFEQFLGMINFDDLVSLTVQLNFDN